MFDSLSKSTQIALFIKQQKDPELLEMQMQQGEFKPYMSVPDRMVVADPDSTGGIYDHVFMVTDNHDDSFTISTPTSSEETIANETDKNSWWETTNKVTKDELMSLYNTSRGSIDQLATSLDLSHASETFTPLPVEQDTKPVTATSESEDNGCKLIPETTFKRAYNE